VESSEGRGEKGEGRAETLVCFALPEEAAPFRKLSGVCGNPGILVTGIGRRNSERKFREAIENAAPALVLTCGFAGALDPVLKLGDVVFDADVDGGLNEKLGVAGAKKAKFHCSPRVAVTGVEKTELRRATGADVVEMESQIIRDICREKKIPSATVRVISDAANEDLPLDFNLLMTPEQNLSFAKLALAIMKSPGKIPQLLALQRKTRFAARRLAQVLEKLLRLSRHGQI
jgi:nucleoside phosphorylase